MPAPVYLNNSSTERASSHNTNTELSSENSSASFHTPISPPPSIASQENLVSIEKLAEAELSVKDLYIDGINNINNQDNQEALKQLIQAASVNLDLSFEQGYRLNQHLKRTPFSAEAADRLASYYAGLEQWGAALPYYEQASKSNDSSCYELALKFAGLDPRWPRALINLERAIEYFKHSALNGNIHAAKHLFYLSYHGYTTDLIYDAATYNQKRIATPTEFRLKNTHLEEWVKIVEQNKIINDKANISYKNPAILYWDTLRTLALKQDDQTVNSTQNAEQLIGAFLTIVDQALGPNGASQTLRRMAFNKLFEMLSCKFPRKNQETTADQRNHSFSTAIIEKLQKTEEGLYFYARWLAHRGVYNSTLLQALQRINTSSFIAYDAADLLFKIKLEFSSEHFELLTEVFIQFSDMNSKCAFLLYIARLPITMLLYINEQIIHEPALNDEENTNSIHRSNSENDIDEDEEENNIIKLANKSEHIYDYFLPTELNNIINKKTYNLKPEKWLQDACKAKLKIAVLLQKQQETPNTFNCSEKDAQSLLSITEEIKEDDEFSCSLRRNLLSQTYNILTQAPQESQAYSSSATILSNDVLERLMNLPGNEGVDFCLKWLAYCKQQKALFSFDMKHSRAIAGALVRYAHNDAQYSLFIYFALLPRGIKLALGIKIGDDQRQTPLINEIPLDTFQEYISPPEIEEQLIKQIKGHYFAAERWLETACEKSHPHAMLLRKHIGPITKWSSDSLLGINSEGMQTQECKFPGLAFMYLMLSINRKDGIEDKPEKTLQKLSFIANAFRDTSYWKRVFATEEMKKEEDRLISCTNNIIGLVPEIKDNTPFNAAQQICAALVLYWSMKKENPLLSSPQYVLHFAPYLPRPTIKHPLTVNQQALFKKAVENGPVEQLKVMSSLAH